MNQPRTLTLTEIGTFKSSQKENYQAGRQPDELGEPGEIKLFSGQQFEQALQDLDGCSHIWILFGFHRNENWKPLVQTPRSTRKIGVFATRAPYRPNPIGMSLVKLENVEGLTIQVGANDILDGSPIYDIKPYHPESDIVEDSHVEWLEKDLAPKQKVFFSPVAEEQLEWLEREGLKEIRTFAQRQLEYDPTNKSKKRVEENDQGYWTLAYRTWRIDFTSAESQVGVLMIRSGYGQADLDTSSLDFNDTYHDKVIHRAFSKEFGTD